MWKIFEFFLGGGRTKTNTVPMKDARGTKPVGIKSGRSSVDNNQYYFNQYAPVRADFPLDYLPVLNYLSIFHHDISNLVQKVVDLAGTEYQITFDEGVKDKDAKAMRAYIGGQAGYSNDYSAGSHSLVNNLLRQVVVYGSLSAERVISSDLKEVERVVMVSPEEIFFFYYEGDYLPYQKVKFIQPGNALGTYKPLNTFSYKYIPMIQASQVPYAIPPLLSAMDIIGIERTLLKNFENISKKVGMFGFLEVLLTAPERLENEIEEDYVARCIAYRDSVAPQVQDTLNEGYVVGFDGKHKFNLAGGNINSAGAEKMLQMVDIIKMSGMKIDPNMLGRHNTVTETFGRVLLSLLISNVKSYQQVVSAFLADTFRLDLILAGYNVGTVKVEFSEPVVSDELKKAQADGVKIDNIIKKYNQGIISQQQAAQELGYDKPANDAPLGIGAAAKPQPNTAGNARSSNSLSKYASLPAFDYSVPEEYSFSGETDWKDPITQSFADNYLGSVTDIYNEAVSKVGNKAVKAIRKAGAEASQASVESSVLLAVYTGWETYFTSLVRPKTKKNVSAIYKFYRFDSSVVPNQKQNSRFDAVKDLSLLDKKTIDFMSKYDSLYLGKFITDPDTKAKMTAFIQQWYLDHEGQVDSEDALKEFRTQFKDVLKNEGWKIRRIINTTVNKLRAYGNVSYMDSAGVDKFRIVEIMDQITCPHCKAINGREFSVSDAKAKIKKVVEGAVDDVGKYSPFATGFSVDEINTKSDSELQALGIDSPPFHPSCRGRVIGVVE